MKVLVRRTNPKEVRVSISTEYIKLESFLKLCDAVPSGGMAKNLIQNGEILVNGQVCLMRGKKLRAGDRVKCFGAEYVVTANAD